MEEAVAWIYYKKERRACMKGAEMEVQITRKSEVVRRLVLRSKLKGFDQGRHTCLSKVEDFSHEWQPHLKSGSQKYLIFILRHRYPEQLLMALLNRMMHTNS